jgi:DNA-binding NtrC family response regulator
MTRFAVAPTNSTASAVVTMVRMRQIVMLQVLMVDDDPGQLRIREIVLRAAGLAVQLAIDVESALALLRSAADQIGVVVTDHFLNGRTGVDLVRELRLTTPSLPVVVLTGMPGIEHEYDGLNVSVWLKPVPPDQLIQLIKRSLSQ